MAHSNFPIGYIWTQPTTSFFITEDYIYTKGDNNNYVDPPVEKTLVVGELVDHIPEYHFIKRWLAESILEL